MEPIDIDKLEEVAKKATPGARGCYNGFGPCGDGSHHCHFIGINGERIIWTEYQSEDIAGSHADLEFIAHCTRETLLALIQRIRDQDSELREARKIVAPAIEYANDLQNTISSIPEEFPKISAARMARRLLLRRKFFEAALSSQKGKSE